MSIRNTRATANAQRHQQAIDQQHEKEAEVRPDPIHRAVVFLLSQAALNNPDFAREAKYHLDLLDQKYSPATPEQRQAVDKGSATQSPLPPTIDVPDVPVNSAAQEAANELPIDTSAQVRMSSRFGTRGGAVRPTRVHRPALEEPKEAPPATPPAAPAGTRKRK